VYGSRGLMQQAAEILQHQGIDADLMLCRAAVTDRQRYRVDGAPATGTVNSSKKMYGGEDAPPLIWGPSGYHAPLREVRTMNRILVMLSISLVVVLVAGGLLSIPAEARGTRSGPVQVLDQDLIRDAQRQLKALGFNPGAVDGNFGPQTEAALRAYQHAHRLPETGRLDDVSVRSLLPERFETSRAPTDFSNREMIIQAQRQLKALGFNPGDVDGNFGAQTEAALRAYQHAYRLPETGRLDDVTMRSLLPERAQSSPAPVDSSQRELMRRAQVQLRALGFDPGGVDGDFGPQTEAALRAYQHAHRLPQTGRLDDVTVRSLLPEMRQGAVR
jgi:peptidoglycan hydrolase-like protein with peptidoglycan-binding domain